MLPEELISMRILSQVDLLLKEAHIRSCGDLDIFSETGFAKLEQVFLEA